MSIFKPPILTKDKKLQPTIKRLRTFKRSDENNAQRPTKKPGSSDLSDTILTSKLPNDITHHVTRNLVQDYVGSLSVMNKSLLEHFGQNFLNEEPE